MILADRSIRLPIEILVDGSVLIEKCLIPIDFVVLELFEEPKNPLIFGRPFLATAGTIIDVKKGKIKLHLGDNVLWFDVDQSLKKPTIAGQVFWIDQVTEVTEWVYDELVFDYPL